MDGTISLRDSKGRVLWTFGTGSPIYSSYQAGVQATVNQDNASELTNSFFIDCGEDWGLYAHGLLGRMVGMPFLLYCLCLLIANFSLRIYAS